MGCKTLPKQEFAPLNKNTYAHPSKVTKHNVTMCQFNNAGLEYQQLLMTLPALHDHSKERTGRPPHCCYEAGYMEVLSCQNDIVCQMLSCRMKKVSPTSIFMP